MFDVVALSSIILSLKGEQPEPARMAISLLDQTVVEKTRANNVAIPRITLAFKFLFSIFSKSFFFV